MHPVAGRPRSTLLLRAVRDPRASAAGRRRGRLPLLRCAAVQAAGASRSAYWARHDLRRTVPALVGAMLGGRRAVPVLADRSAGAGSYDLVRIAPARPRPRRCGCWASTTGRGGRASATAPSWSTWRVTVCSICCPTARPRHSPRGCELTPAWRSFPAGAYAEGATLGASEAVQVADRFHLLRNPPDAVERALERHRRAVHAAVPLLERPARAPSKRGGPAPPCTPGPRAPEREGGFPGAPARDATNR